LEEKSYSPPESYISDVWNIFHKQEALKNGRHALISEFETPNSGELEQQLQERLADNFAVYKQDIMDLNKDELFKSAAEIASVSEAFAYFSTEHGFIESEVDFLLKFENPLELLSEKWDVGLRNLPNTLDAIFGNQERTLQKGGYTLISDEPSPVISAAPARNNAGADGKLSVIEQIRQAAKESRERTIDPKETPGKKKSEPDL